MERNTSFFTYYFHSFVRKALEEIGIAAESVGLVEQNIEQAEEPSELANHVEQSVKEVG